MAQRKIAKTNEILAARFAGRDLAEQARRMARAYRRLGNQGGLIRKTNEASLQWVSERAQANLSDQITAHRRPRIHSHTAEQTLEQVIANPASHSVSGAGFRFMIKKNVYRQIPYAFSLEYGDRSQIGRDISFLFLGRERQKGDSPARYRNRSSDIAAGRLNTAFRGSKRRSAAFVRANSHRFAANVSGDRIIGPREYATRGPFEGKRSRVVIQNPVPQYRYGRDAAKAFNTQHVYARLLLELFERGGGDVSGIVLRQGKANISLTSRSRRLLAPQK